MSISYWFWNRVVYRSRSLSWISRQVGRPIGWINRKTEDIRKEINYALEEENKKSLAKAEQYNSYHICDEYNRFKCDSECFHARPHKFTKQCETSSVYRRCKHRDGVLASCIKKRIALCPGRKKCGHEHDCKHAKPHPFDHNCSGEYCKRIHEHIDCVLDFRYLSDKEKAKALNESFAAHKQLSKGR